MSLEAPSEVVGLKEIKEPGAIAPFIVVRLRNGGSDGREKFLLKTGEGVSWEVTVSLGRSLGHITYRDVY